MKYWLLTFLLALTASAQAKIQLEVTDSYEFKIVPSASGVIYYNNTLYAIGDDTPYLFQFNQQLQMVQQQLMKEYLMRDEIRINSRIKPDFEALGLTRFNSKDFAVILGSGSKSPTRDVALVRNMGSGEISEIVMTDFYRYLHNVANFSEDEDINIEGVAFDASNAYLANRGNSGENFIFVIEKSAFLTYLIGGGQLDIPTARVIQVSLPRINNIEAGLSGLEYSFVQKALYYTASVEDTENAYIGGAILGSFVGKIDINELSKSSIDATDASPLTQNGERIITKAESLTFNLETSDTLQAIVVSDSDDGRSQVYKVNISQN